MAERKPPGTTQDAWYDLAWDELEAITLGGWLQCGLLDPTGGWSCSRHPAHTGPHVTLGRKHGLRDPRGELEIWGSGVFDWPPALAPATRGQLSGLLDLLDVFEVPGGPDRGSG